MIYFDGVHLATDSDLSELHREARLIGLKREWFQEHSRHPHYDVFGAPAKRLAVNCTSRELLRKCKHQAATVAEEEHDGKGTLVGTDTHPWEAR